MARSRILLAVSLMVNVFTIGVIGGGIFMLSKPSVWQSLMGAAPGGVGRAGSNLPAADHEAFRRAMLRVFDENAEAIRTARESRETAARLFVQPQFDRSAITGALDRARQADILVRTRVEAAQIEFAATLPANKRAVLAQGLAGTGTLRRSQ